MLTRIWTNCDRKLGVFFERRDLKIRRWSDSRSRDLHLRSKGQTRVAGISWFCGIFNVCLRGDSKFPLFLDGENVTTIGNKKLTVWIRLVFFLKKVHFQVPIQSLVIFFSQIIQVVVGLPLISYHRCRFYFITLIVEVQLYWICFVHRWSCCSFIPW